MHTAASGLYTDDGFMAAPSANGAGAITAPIAAASGLIGGASAHLHLWGLVLFLLALWGLVRMAGFRFVISTGIGR